MTATASLRSVYRVGVLILAAALALSLATQPAAAQRGVGRMQGRVLDSDGNGLEGVQIVATNPSATPNRRTIETSAGGRAQSRDRSGVETAPSSPIRSRIRSTYSRASHSRGPT